MRLFGRDGISRRRFLAGSAAATAVTAASLALSGCGEGKEVKDTSGQPQVVDDASQIIDVLDEYKDADLSIAQSGEWSLPLGTLLFHCEGSWSAAMMTPESAASPNSIGVLSLANGSLLTLIGSPTLGRAYSFFDVRSASGVFSWVEIEYATLSWTLLARSFADGSLSGDAVELDHGDSDWEPPCFTCTGSSVIWQKMPSTSGSKTSEKSHCYRWSVGDGSSSEEIWESLGRFATSPRVSEGVLTIVPRVLNDEGTYYGMTAVDLSSPKFTKLDQLVLPAGVRPFEAVYMGDSFAFSIEASYDGVGSLGNMGTFIGREGGSYAYLSREPAACVAGKGTRYLMKTRASHCLIDTAEQTYALLACPDRALDYGDYPASEGVTDTFVTYAAVKDDQGIPSSVTARAFTL